jgi:enoyl-[acyl-carrier protein] reductase I
MNWRTIGTTWHARQGTRKLWGTSICGRDDARQFARPGPHDNPGRQALGRKALVVGIANEHSIAWGCARWLRALGADVAVTYRRERTRSFVEPLAAELESAIVMPLDVSQPGQMEAVFERIAKEWGGLDTVVHSIAFSPKEALCGRVVDVRRDDFMTTLDVSC